MRINLLCRLAQTVFITQNKWRIFSLQALDEFATKLIQNNHYAMDDVATRRDAVSIQHRFRLQVFYFIILNSMATIWDKSLEVSMHTADFLIN